MSVRSQTISYHEKPERYFGEIQWIDGMRIMKFQRLLSVASKFRVMKNKGDHCVMHGKLRSVFPNLSNEQSKVVAVTLCSFFLQDYP